MRRIASVFRRNDKNKRDRDDPSVPSPNTPTSPIASLASKLHTLPRQQSKKSRSLSSRIFVPTDPPPAVPPRDQNHSSSSSSSSGSTSLQTPEDDRGSHLAPHTPSSLPPSPNTWSLWTSKFSPHSLTPSPSPTPSSSLHSSDLVTTPAVLSPSLPQPSVATARLTRPDGDQDSASTPSRSESLGSPYPTGVPLSSPAPKLPGGRTLPPLEYLETLTVNALVPRISQPPLLHAAHVPLFPRSVNSPVFLDPPRSLEVVMHKDRLLGRMRRRLLSPADHQVLAALGSRSASHVTTQFTAQPEEGARYDLRFVRSHSHGMRRWTARPYFEERMVVWQPNPVSGVAEPSAVKSAGFGVLSLEVSEAMEFMAGSGLDETRVPASPFLPLPLGKTTSEPPSLPSTATPRSNPLSTPSLYNNSNSSMSSLVTTKPSKSSGPASTSQTVPLPTDAIVPTVVVLPAEPDVPKRGVRFTPNAKKEDAVPHDYVLRIQRNRAEKARFLHEEQERRKLEEERQKFEEERREWREEKLKWEREKRAMEEERKRKSYADELAAARARRETQHALPSSSSRDSRETYSRPVYDTRRYSSSDSGGHGVPVSNSARVRESSSSSSQQSGAPRSINGSSRPPSTFSSTSIASTDDSRMKENRVSRRTSAMSESSLRHATPMVGYGWPVNAAIPPVPMMPVSHMPGMPMMSGYPALPMVPVLPQYAAMPLDMPLLPPNAPFMMHGNGSRSRMSSRDSSPNRPVNKLSQNYGNHSTDRLPSYSGSSSGSVRGRSQRRADSSEVLHDRVTSSQASRSSVASAGVRPQFPSQNSWGAPMPPVPHSAPLPVRRSTAFS